MNCENCANAYDEGYTAGHNAEITRLRQYAQSGAATFEDLYVRDREIARLREQAEGARIEISKLEPSYQLLIEFEEQERWSDLLGNVLAVLNSDGGHYQVQHGVGRAAINGIRRHYRLCEQADALAAALEELQATVQATCEGGQVDIPGLEILGEALDKADATFRAHLEARHE